MHALTIQQKKIKVKQQKINSHVKKEEAAGSEQTCWCVLTVEGVQVYSQSAGLAVAFPTFPTHIRPITSVCSHVASQFNGLGEDCFAVLTHIHLP